MIFRSQVTKDSFEACVYVKRNQITCNHFNQGGLYQTLISLRGCIYKNYLLILSFLKKMSYVKDLFFYFQRISFVLTFDRANLQSVIII